MKENPSKVPVVMIHIGDGDSELELGNPRFLFPRDFTLDQVSTIIRRKLELDKNTALFMYLKNRLVKGKQLHELYDQYKDTDNVLYLCYSRERTLG